MQFFCLNRWHGSPISSDEAVSHHPLDSQTGYYRSKRQRFADARHVVDDDVDDGAISISGWLLDARSSCSECCIARRYRTHFNMSVSVSRLRLLEISTGEEVVLHASLWPYDIQMSWHFRKSSSNEIDVSLRSPTRRLSKKMRAIFAVSRSRREAQSRPSSFRGAAVSLDTQLNTTAPSRDDGHQSIHLAGGRHGIS